jgi:hypothetical protein
MTNAEASRVSPNEIADLIERASREPGLNDILNLLQLSREFTDIDHLRQSWGEQPLAAQVSSTHGWLW